MFLAFSDFSRENSVLAVDCAFALPSLGKNPNPNTFIAKILLEGQEQKLLFFLRTGRTALVSDLLNGQQRIAATTCSQFRRDQRLSYAAKTFRVLPDSPSLRVCNKP